MSRFKAGDVVFIRSPDALPPGMTLEADFFDGQLMQLAYQEADYHGRPTWVCVVLAGPKAHRKFRMHQDYFSDPITPEVAKVVYGVEVPT